MKGKWINFYSRLAAGAVVTGSVIAANKIAKKYGQKPNDNKFADLNLYNIADYAVNKFLNADDEKIQKMISVISKK